MKKALLTFLLGIFVLGSHLSSGVAADVFLGWDPYDITIDEGDHLRLPIFFLTPEWEGMPVEFFLLAEVPADIPAEKYCYTTSRGWFPLAGETALPVASISGMYRWANVMFQGPVHPPLNGSDSFSLIVCVDGTVDGVITGGTTDCGQKRFNVFLSLLPACDGLLLKDVSGNGITETELTTGVTGTATALVFVTDGCGYSADFEATAPATATWLTLSYDTGVLVLVADGRDLEEGQAYETTVTITGNETQTTLRIRFIVTQSSCPSEICSPTK